MADDGHVVNLSTKQGLEDLMCLALFAETQNVLAVETYAECQDPDVVKALDECGVSAAQALAEWDISNVAEEERIMNVYARGRMTALLAFAGRHGKCTTENGDEVNLVDDVFSRELARLLRGLGQYYQNAHRAMKTTIQEHLFDRQIEALIGESPVLQRYHASFRTEENPTRCFLPRSFVPMGCRWTFEKPSLSKRRLQIPKNC